MCYFAYMNQMIITECPRDAMQGLPYFIPTSKKVEYLKLLIETGFQRLDIGSFVSPKAIPQLADTPQYLGTLMNSKGKTEFLVITASARRAKDAARHPGTDILGFPWSMSPHFLESNIRSTPGRSRILISKLLDITAKHNKKLLVYISMAYGNPYGEDWSPSALVDAFAELVDLGVNNIALSDTVGHSDPDNIYSTTNEIINTWPGIETGFHLHTRPELWKARIEAAWEGGCRRFDSVLNGLGGCPMTGHDLVGNLDTFSLLSFCRERGILHNLDEDLLIKARQLAGSILSSGDPLPYQESS